MNIITNNITKQWAKDLSRLFSKEDIQMANKHVKRHPTLLITRERQVKATVRYHLTLIRVIKKSANYKCWRGCGEKGTLLPCWQECKLNSHYGEQYGEALKNQEYNYHMSQQSHYWAYTLRKPQFKKTHVPQCSLQHYLQQPGHGSNLDAHQQMNG